MRNVATRSVGGVARGALTAMVKCRPGLQLAGITGAGPGGRGFVGPTLSTTRAVAHMLIPAGVLDSAPKEARRAEPIQRVDPRSPPRPTRRARPRRARAALALGGVPVHLVGRDTGGHPRLRRRCRWRSSPDLVESGRAPTASTCCRHSARSRGCAGGTAASSRSWPATATCTTGYTNFFPLYPLLVPRSARGLRGCTSTCACYTGPEPGRARRAS